MMVVEFSEMAAESASIIATDQLDRIGDTRMFSFPIRQTGLAVASLALAVSALVTPAAAAPIPTAGAAAEEAVAGPPIKLPIANLVVTKKSKQGDPHQSQTYMFEIKNFGPDPAVVKFRKQVTWFTASGQAQASQFDYTMPYALEVGGVVPVQIDCDPGQGGYCYKATLSANPIGLDPNTSNNVDYYQNPNP
jgi:hypothetical protein